MERAGQRTLVQMRSAEAAIELNELRAVHRASALMVLSRTAEALCVLYRGRGSALVSAVRSCVGAARGWVFTVKGAILTAVEYRLLSPASPKRPSAHKGPATVHCTSCDRPCAAETVCSRATRQGRAEVHSAGRHRSAIASGSLPTRLLCFASGAGNAES